jgi:pimeloyl-ACP methyl ester carboxylesterase
MKTMKELISKLIGLGLNMLALIAPQKAARMGFELFCHPFRSKITDKHKEFLHAANLFQFQHKGETIQGYSWGKGEHSILLLHGWQSHTFRWKNYVQAFDHTQYTVYAFDAPGHGLSSGKFMTVPFYSEVVETFLTDRGKVNTVLSHSIGGFTSIYTFHRLPHLSPDKLIVMAPPGEAQDFFDFYTEQLNLSKRTVQLIVDYFEEQINQAPSYFSAHKFAATLQSKGLLIHDEGDDETSVENSKRIHAAWKNSALIVTQGYGHNLKSPRVIEHVVNFVEGKNVEAAAAEITFR